MEMKLLVVIASVVFVATCSTAVAQDEKLEPVCFVMNAKQARCILQKDDTTFEVKVCSWTTHGADCR
jgi:hypothetical protein